MRADQLIPRQRIEHPHMGQTVEVVGVRVMRSATRVRFRAHGQHGSFDCPSDTEIKEIK